MGIDDLFRQMQEDELDDKIELTTHATPIEYARSRGMAPQKVYYALRNHADELKTEQCKCGRRVLDITTADLYFGFKEKNDETAEGNEDDDPKETTPGSDEVWSSGLPGTAG
jgi:hypothetical protein